jgi:regulatory protein
VNRRALEFAYGYLSRRERTVRELRDHLAHRGIDAPAVESAVKELIVTGYLDDRRYARLFVQDRRRLDGWGSGRIRQALLTKGVEADLVSEALAERDDGAGVARRGESMADGIDEDPDGPSGELGRALALLERRFPEPPAGRRERQRALAVLLRRGYEPELALDALAAHSRGRR